jgi:NAD(P)-dependent dehydrogenase (short-subunit alcohol dehydrogenase family)
MTALNIVITGASRGIGYELTLQALELGHRVIAGCRKPSQSLELRALLETHPEKLKIHELDVQEHKSVAKFAAAIGNEPVDILINNAGVYLDGESAWSELKPELLQETLLTNSIGPVRMSQALLPLLKKSKQPRVANITSLMGSLEDNSSGGSLAYRMSKTALNMFTKNLSLDEKELIVLSLHPGWVQTEMGGKRAPLAAKTSAEGLLRVIRGSTLKESGKFFSYNAKELPW